jgi:hypothetical protein
MARKSIDKGPPRSSCSSAADEIDGLLCYILRSITVDYRTELSEAEDAC